MTAIAGAEPPRFRLRIDEEGDVVLARRHLRELGRELGFPDGRLGALATAVSEVARNIVVHARGGELLLGVAVERGRRGIYVVARDEAPGIADVARAMEDGYSTGSGLGLGLPSARRLVDEFSIASAVGAGTTVVMKKWTHDRA